MEANKSVLGVVSQKKSLYKSTSVLSIEKTTIAKVIVNLSVSVSMVSKTFLETRSEIPRWP